MGAKFTVKNGNVEQDVPSPLFLHLSKSGQSKHLHLHGVAEQDMGDLVVAPVDKSVVQVSKVVRVKMAKKVTDPNSVWGFDLTPLKVGNTDLQAKVKGAVVAILKVSVIQALELPPEDTDEGMRARLFLAETASPEHKGWDPDRRQEEHAVDAAGAQELPGQRPRPVQRARRQDPSGISSAAKASSGASGVTRRLRPTSTGTSRRP